MELVTARAESIANLDVSENISKALINRNDEIGMLSNSFQRIIDNLRAFIKRTSETSEQLALSSKELTISSEQSAISANEVAKVIEDIAQGATQQAVDTENGAKHISDLGELVEHNEDFLRELNISTTEIDRLKDEGFEILRELIKNTESNNRQQ